MESSGAKWFLSKVKLAYERDAKRGVLTFKNNLVLHRGPYDIVAVMDESVNSNPVVIKDLVIDLFDPMLPVLKEKTIMPGQQAYRFNLSRVDNRAKPQVLATAARVYNETVVNSSYNFVAKSFINTLNSMRILLSKAFKKVLAMDSKDNLITEAKTSWDGQSKTTYLGFANNPDGVKIVISW